MAITSRRRFLVLSARAAVAVPLVACADDGEGVVPDSGSDTGNDTAGDAGADAGQDAGTDVLEDALDAATDVADVAADTVADVEVDAGPIEQTREVLQVTKGPWSMIWGAGAVAVRMEARVDATIEATLITPEGERLTGTIDSNTVPIEFMWPPVESFRSDYRDEIGDHTLYDIAFTDLTPGARYTYELSTNGAAPVTGTFMAPPEAGQAFNVTWVADTMFPMSEDTGAMAGEAAGDLFLHGGDIQYFSNPLDTWNGYFAYYGAALAHSVGHHAIGNHEYENYNEYESHFLRLFGGQGEDGGTDEYFAFSFGGWRFIFMNSEVGFGEPGSDQSNWMEAELAAASARDDHRGTVVVFHRGLYTFGKTRPLVDARNYMHPLFKEHGVRLVLTGHNHGYERFVVEDIAYVTDAGGGAGLTNIDDHLEEIAAERPEEPALRVVKSSTYGILTMAFHADGGISATRTAVSGEVVDTFEITSPA